MGLDDSGNGKARKDVHQAFPATADESAVALPLGDDLHDLEGKAAQYSQEQAFDKTPIPPWQEQITFRALVVSFVLGGFFCIVTHKLSLTVGVIPSLNVSAGLLGFFFVKLWVSMLSKLNIWSKPFTRQENTVIQTCVVSCCGIAFSGGFGSYILSMNSKSYNSIGSDTPGNRLEDVKNPSLGWLYAFIFTVSFMGIMVIVPLRKIMVLKYKLTYPSGTATAVLINGFHTPHGAVQARKQVGALAKTLGLTFFWSFFKWFFSGTGDLTCGFDNFPSLGYAARKNRFMFDFNMVYVGAGMICPHIVNISTMLGAIISWGIMWPLIGDRAGDWYPARYKGGSNFKGLNGYKVFIAIALILGDGIYNLVKIILISAISFYKNYRESQRLPDRMPQNNDDPLTIDEKKREETFLKDRIPIWVAAAGYVGLAAISIGVMPQIFPTLKWYYVLLCYIIGPVLAFCNAYGTGLTDWSLASTYGKVGMFVFAAWAGSSGGGVMAGLAACGVMMNMVSTASDLMQDFKTGYLTRASPRSMFVSQLIGAVYGCILAPITFWMFWVAFDVGNADGPYKAPYGVVYRQMAIIGTEGFSALPTHCLELCYGFFAMAVVVNGIRDLVPKKYAKFIPIPMAMAIPFYIGAYFAIDMFIGTCIVYIYQRVNRKKSEIYVPAIASGLICGEGIWSLPAAMLAVAKVNPPLCMMFYPVKVAAKVQEAFAT